MGIYKKKSLNNVERPTKRGQFFAPGNYIVEADKISEVNSRKGKRLFCMECTVVESDNPKRKVGSPCTWMTDMNLDAAPQNILNLLASLVGRDIYDDASFEAPDEEGNAVDWDELSDLAVAEVKKGDDHPFKGTRVGVECFTYTVKGGDRDDPADQRDICRFRPVEAA